MSRINLNSGLTRQPLIELAAGLFVLLNLGLAILRLLHKAFNADEMQHLHIAWLIAQGEILYRDFWEHHGPVYSLINGALIFMTDAEPTVGIIFWARAASFLMMLGVGFLTWKIAREMGMSRTAAWLAVAACASLDMIQNKGTEMRPDVPQTLFWIAGLLLLLRNQSGGTLKQAACAGALFALSILCNAKAGIGPFFVVVFYGLAHWLCRMTWSDIARDLLGMAIGALVAAAPMLLYFAANDALDDFLYFNYIWNVLFSISWSADFQAVASASGTSLANEYLEFYAKDQLPFLLLTIAGSALWLRRLASPHEQASRQRNWLFTIVTVGTTLGWLTNRHSQYFLIFLPLLAILTAYALAEIARLFPARLSKTGIAVSGATAFLAAAAMLAFGAQNTPFRETELLRAQKDFTQQFVAMTERDEPVGVVWSLCGGYMFNANTGFYWVAMPTHSDIIEIISGEHPFRKSFIDSMERQQVRYVIGVENWKSEGLSQEARDYLKKNFDYKYCLWTRK